MMVRKLIHFTIVLWIAAVSACAQRYEITPLAGAMFGGSLKLEQLGVSPNRHADFEDSASFGIAGGIRFYGEECDDCSLIEFRWMRQPTHLGFKQDPLAPVPVGQAFHPRVTVDRFLGDFTAEMLVNEVRNIRPFITVTLGAARMDAPASSATRFVWGIGTGMKVFPQPHWGFRIGVEYLPMVLHTELQSIVCNRGCIVALNGGMTSQFQVTIGPAFRF